MKKHILKTINPYFQDVWDNKKTFEIRLNDRDFKVGDELVLIEYDPITDSQSGREIYTKVPYILKDKPFVPDGYVCMSIKEYFRKEVLQNKMTSRTG